MLFHKDFSILKKIENQSSPPNKNNNNNITVPWSGLRRRQKEAAAGVPRYSVLHHPAKDQPTDDTQEVAKSAPPPNSQPYTEAVTSCRGISKKAASFISCACLLTDIALPWYIDRPKQKPFTPRKQQIPYKSMQGHRGWRQNPGGGTLLTRQRGGNKNLQSI